MGEESSTKMAVTLSRSAITPVVIVLGATGAGKSKLAFELAQKFGGEVISADAMQMYKGLDIVTNKVSKHERTVVKHHMIDFLDPMSKCTVVDFRNMALPIINELRSKNVMPIICGGTNYYIESLIWKILIEDEFKSTLVPISNKKAKLSKQSVDNYPTSDKHDEILCRTKNKEEDAQKHEIAICDKNAGYASNMELYEQLKVVDPKRANDLHFNARRKIIRSLEVYNKFKRPHSDILKDQKSEAGGGILGGPLRFHKDELAVLWVQCDQTTLDNRCDKRVHKMIEEGMLEELKAFHSNYNEERASSGEMPDYTNGIFQSIGFKEFHKYLTCREDETDEKKKDLYKKGVEQLQLVTRQYARKQVKWMRQRFLHFNRICPNVYKLDSTQYPDKWKDDVYNPAVAIVQAFIDGEKPQCSPMECDGYVGYSHEQTRQMFSCETCNLSLQGTIQLEAHLKSGRHARMLKHLQKTSQILHLYENKLKYNLKAEPDKADINGKKINSEK